MLLLCTVSHMLNFRQAFGCRDRLFAEIRVLKQLKHKNIMTFYDSWLDQKTYSVNFITEMFTSGTLRQYVLSPYYCHHLCGLRHSFQQTVLYSWEPKASASLVCGCVSYCVTCGKPSSIVSCVPSRAHSSQWVQVSQAPQAH